MPDQPRKKVVADLALTASLPARAIHGVQLPETYSISGREITKTPDSEGKDSEMRFYCSREHIDLEVLYCSRVLVSAFLPV